MRRTLPSVLVLSILWALVAGAAPPGEQARYVGGTLTGLAENSEGTLELGDEALIFVAKKGGTRIAIPYNKVQSLEYGQKAGRRVAAAVVVSPLFLFSKKRKHFVTIEFLDEAGKKQGAVLELAKGIVKETLSLLETKSGKKVEFESEEARKHFEKQ